jgi:hypothetical protein
VGVREMKGKLRKGLQKDKRFSAKREKDGRISLSREASKRNSFQKMDLLSFNG